MHRLLIVGVALLLSGCVEPDPAEDGDGTGSSTSTSSAPGGGGSFAPQQGTAHGEDQGIELEVTWKTCAAGFCANATATNNGTQTVQVSSICIEPWDERMTRDGEVVAHREDQVVCLAYGRKPFAPGDSAQHDFTWDGRLHERDSSAPAPEGSYTWTLVFWWDDAQGGSRQEATADVHVIVGET